MSFWEYLTNRRMLLLAERLAQYGISAEDVKLILAMVERPESRYRVNKFGYLAKRAGWR
jgi:hypothetical protein